MMMSSSIIDWSNREARNEWQYEYQKNRDPKFAAAAALRHRAKDPEKWRESNNKSTKLHRLKHPDAHRIAMMKYRYNFTKSDFIELWEKQNGHCANPDCNIKLVDPIFFEERSQYYDDSNLIEGVDYAYCTIDHDHDYEEKHGKCKEMVRGLLCQSCNRKDVLDPDSKHYIHNPKVSDFTE